MTKRKVSDPDFDIVKLHSKQKHSFLKGYLRIWTETVGGNKGAEAPTLQLVDLYAGTGACKEEYDGDIWDGSAVLMARALAEYPSKWPCLLYVNSFNEKGGDDQARQLARVTERIHASGLPRENRPLTISTTPVAKAVAEAKRLVN
ncbi:MAG: hypothetical protein HYT80_07920, partial [Euryarchaeota archaeon]|nr:hypothetical protein [Euryarchaeota archaeon]